MVDLVQFVLRSSYYYGRLIGVINFEIDLETGEPRLTRRATLWAIAINVLTFSLVPLLISSRVWQVFLVHANSLHQYVFLVMIFFRVSCVFVTVLSRWWQRQQLVRLLRSYRRLTMKQPHVVRLWRRGVIAKGITSFSVESIHIFLGVYGVRDMLTPTIALSVFLIYLIISWMNIILAQYFFSLLNVHGHYLLMNEELRRIVAETHLLKLLDHGKSLRQLKYCALADRLDSVALLQSQLQSLVRRLTQIFGPQTLCIYITFNATLISGTYYAFSAIRYSVDIDWTSAKTILTICGAILYMTDSHLTYSITSYVEIVYKEMSKIIAQYPTFAQDVDRRLITAFENLKMQLVSNPQKLSVMGLYNLERTTVLGIFSSVISHSLILIQYDIKHYNAG
ncbi:PREDICTED: putative gustatory receptor 59d [Drosophila arizonae]|uniref:Gustatory receptor n=1 Tax=Drosophila arizonae TaxID=7263 RepID=A0ABM1PBU3_DROAR|nr:PREDICTED: putative gustatory receptor 59d [Drosophila arizonae]